MKQIKFKKVVLQNFKVHENAEMEFKDNSIILLTGSNGSGKTTFLDAITWACYDKTLEGASADEVIRNKAGKNCSVILEFDVDSDCYRIENYRKHSVHKNSKLLFKNNIDITETKTAETNKLIEKILMPLNVFKNSLVFSKFASSFMLLKHSEQKEIIDSILDLSIYDEYYEKVSKYLNDEESEKKIVQNKKDNIVIEYNTKKDNHIYNINKYKNDIETVSEELKTKNDDFKNVQSNNSISKKDITEKKKELQNKYLENKTQLSQIESEVSKLNELYNSNIKNLTSTFDKNKETIQKDIESKNKMAIEKINVALEKSKSQKMEIELKVENKKSEELKKFNDLIKSERDAFDIEKNKFDTKNNELLVKINSISEKLKSYQSDKKVESEKLNQIDNTSNKNNKICFACKQDLVSKESIENIKSLRDEIAGKIKSLDSSIKSSETECNKLKETQNKLREKYNDYVNSCKEKNNGHTNNYNSVLDQINEGKNKVLITFETSLQEFNQKKSALFDSIKIEINKEIDKLEKIYNKEKSDLENKLTKEKESQREKYIAIKKISTSIEEEISKCEKELNEYEQLNNKCEILKVEIENLNKTKNMYENLLKDEEVKFKNLELENENITKDFDTKLNKLEKNIEIFKFWKIGFGDTGIKSILLDEAIPILNKKSIELSNLTDCLRVSFDSQTKLKEGDLRDKFRVIATNTKELSETKLLSSGEKHVCNIIILLALRHLLEHMNDVSINLILMDEILDSLDEDRSKIIIEMLQNITKDHCIILISHTIKSMITYDQRYSF